MTRTILSILAAAILPAAFGDSALGKADVAYITRADPLSAATVRQSATAQGLAGGARGVQIAYSLILLAEDFDKMAKNDKAKTKKAQPKKGRKLMTRPRK